eukprot:TRINITY_DN935_c1_g1_i1.p1 TRINITY_DN935_c1_g1~~TRINITY_DN935_c1_g1_i1.p1  ORF type:complete len:353 (+),score=79.30 TRINITY_DN935_c1_g1_i1:67-1125(+)
MQIRLMSAALLAVAHAQIAPVDVEPVDVVPGDEAPGDVAPGDEAPVDGPVDSAPQDTTDNFADWCAVAADCVVGTLDPAAANDVQCIQGSCVCSGAYEDPGALITPDYAGWSCVLIGEPMPFFDMSYTFEWSDENVNCADRAADFDETLRSEVITYFSMSTLTMSEPFCGSIHMAGTGSTQLGGRTGFGNYFASNPVNQFGAPVVVGQKSSLSSCNAVSPVSTAVQVGTLCQPLSCIPGYNLVSSGSVSVLSACVVDPSPSGSTNTPTPGTASVNVVNSNDDDISLGAAMGIAFGISALIVIAVAVIFFNGRKSNSISDHPAEERDIKQNNGPDSDQQESNGPDMEQDELIV